MSNDKESLLTGLQLAYNQRLPERLDEIKSCYIAICNGQTTALEKMHYLVHGIAGSAGSFGYADLGIKAKLLEKEILNLKKKPAKFFRDFTYHSNFVKRITKYNNFIYTIR